MTRLAFAVLFFVSAAALPAAGVAPQEKDPAKEPPAFFYPIPDAKDCAFDQSRDRLYVTTPKKLVVVDTKARKVFDGVELPGGLQGCDISPDFKFLAVAAASAHSVYKIGLKWDKPGDMPVTQIKFKGVDPETGVFSVCVGKDGTVLFSATCTGSSGVTLRTVTPKDKVEVVGQVQMNSVLAPSGDRRYAAIAEGNISSGPLLRYDFTTKKLTPVAKLNGYHYEVACAKGAKYFARPYSGGVDVYDGKGVRLGTLDGAPVIAAAFHPTTDTLFALRHGELNVEEYDVLGRKVANSYPLDKPLVIKADVNVAEIVNLQPVGKDLVIANSRLVKTELYRTYRSGRLKVSEDGKTMFAVVPTGVYVFPVKDAPGDDKPKPKIKVIEPKKP
jgi:hypothetical protein